MALFGRNKQAAPEHAVITHLPLSDDEFGTAEEREAVFGLEDKLESLAAAAGGEHDGHEFGGGEAVLYTYGPDADALLDAVRTALDGFPVRSGAFAIKRYGPASDASAREVRVELA